MKTNNYDQSGTGENISFNLFYDTNAGEQNYKSFIEDEATKIQLNRDNNAYIIGDATAPFYKYKTLAAMKKQDLWDLAHNYGKVYENIPRLELIEILRGIDVKQHYEWLADDNYFYEFKEKIQHDYFLSRGHCQGDVSIIIGIEPLTQSQKTDINHTLWDTPVYLTIDIGGKTFADLLDDQYDYEKDTILEKLKSEGVSEYAQKWLAENLPEGVEE